MSEPYRIKADEASRMLTLSSAANFIFKVKTVLDWGILVWSNKGIDVLTLTDNQKNCFDIRAGDFIIVHENRIWFPFATFNENSKLVEFAKFKTKKSVLPMLTTVTKGRINELFTSISAVHAFTITESNIRPELADVQRKLFARYLRTGDTIRARLKLSELTSANTLKLNEQLETLAEYPFTKYPIVSRGAIPDAIYDVRMLFVHLASNPMLEYVWNKHRYCGMEYVRLPSNTGMLFNEQFALVDADPFTKKAGRIVAELSRLDIPDLLGFTPQKPISVRIIDGMLDDLESLT